MNQIEKNQLINQDISRSNKNADDKLFGALDNKILSALNLGLHFFQNQKKVTLINKFIDFYTNANLTQKQWSSFKTKLHNTKAIQTTVGEFLLDNIDKLNFDKNVEVFGRLASAVASNEMDPSDFFRLSIVLQRTPFIDIQQLKEY